MFVGVSSKTHWFGESHTNSKHHSEPARPPLTAEPQIQTADLIQVFPFSSFRLSLEHRSQGRGSACRAAVAVPPWTKSSPPGTPAPDSKTVWQTMFTWARSDEKNHWNHPHQWNSDLCYSSWRKACDCIVPPFIITLFLLPFFQTSDDSLWIAFRSSSLSNWRGGRGQGFSAASWSAAEPNRSEDAESSGTAGGDETAGVTASSKSSLSSSSWFLLIRCRNGHSGYGCEYCCVLWFLGAAEGQSRERARRQLAIPEGHRLPSPSPPQRLRVSSLQVSFTTLTFCNFSPPKVLICTFNF